MPCEALSNTVPSVAVPVYVVLDLIQSFARRAHLIGQLEVLGIDRMYGQG